MPSSADINAQIHQWMRDAIPMRAEGDAAGVVALYTRVIEMATGDYTIYRATLFRGLARRALGDLSGALDDFKAALRQPMYLLPPGVAAAHSFSGAVEARLGRSKQAKDHFRQVMETCLKTDDNDLEIYFAVPWDIVAAAGDMGLHLAANPRSSAGVFCRGLLWRGLKDGPRAAADFAAAAAEQPRNGRLQAWARTQDELANSRTPYQRPYLRAGTDYVALEYSMDPPPYVMVSRYDVDTRATETISVGEADSLRRRLEREGWLLLYRTNHKEGYSYLYWRAKAALGG